MRWRLQVTRTGGPRDIVRLFIIDGRVPGPVGVGQVTVTPAELADLEARLTTRADENRYPCVRCAKPAEAGAALCPSCLGRSVEFPASTDKALVDRRVTL